MLAGILALAAPRAEAGFLYAATTQGRILGFAVDEAAGALHPLDGFPVQATILGNGLTQLITDETNGRLYALSGDPLSLYEVDSSTGALHEVSFSPFRVPPGLGSLGYCFALPSEGSPLLGAGQSGDAFVSSTNISAAGAIPAPGSPHPLNLPDLRTDCSIATTPDDRFAFIAGGQFSSGSFASVAIEPSGAAGPVLGSPFQSGLPDEVTTVATDAQGRLLVAGRRAFGFQNRGAIQIFTTDSGVPTRVSANPYDSGLAHPGRALVHPGGFYLLADGNDLTPGQIGVYRIVGSGAATRLESVAGSPFSTGDAHPYSLALNASGTLLFVGHFVSGNITIFSVDAATGELVKLSTETRLHDLTGSSELLGGLAFIRSCGNGVLEPGEQCDDGNRRDGDCCSRGCRLDDNGSACDDGNDCTVEQCDGGGLCVKSTVPDGGSCDDCDPCTSDTSCTSGVCSGGAHVPCIDSFECYKARDLRRPPFGSPTVSLSDDLDPFGSQSVRLFKPELVCAAAAVAGGPVRDPETFLSCYGIQNHDGAILRRDRPIVETVDRFGELRLELTDAEMLCVPSELSIIPPGPIGNLVFEVSESNIRSHIAALEGPRDTPERRAKAAEYVASRFQSYGFSITREPVEDSENVVAFLPGSLTPERIFVIGAHFDSVQESPGADDNASGVAALLEVARLLSGQHVASSVELVAFALEEAGLIGSTQHAANLASAGRDVVGMIALEMIGYTCDVPGCQFLFGSIPPCLSVSTEFLNVGDFIAAVANERSSSLLDTFVAAASRYVPALHQEWARVAEDGTCLLDTRRSDHAPFWDRGYPALMITDTANFRNPNYHQPTDRLRTIDVGFARQVTQAALATVLETVQVVAETPVPETESPIDLPPTPELRPP